MGWSSGGTVQTSDNTPVTQAHDDVAAAGTGADVSRDDHRHGMPAGGGAGGALTRVGGNTTEATTTSTSAVDLLSVASLTIATNEPIHCGVSGRKTTGATAAVALGLTLNATVVAEASTSSTRILVTNGNNAAQSRYSAFWLGPRLANYELQGAGVALLSPTADTGVSQGGGPADSAAQPVAEITDLIIRGISNNALTTLGADELHIYSLANS